MRIIATINQKGGVGKTTAVANIGAGLARRGHRVAMLDLDPQSNLSIHFDSIPATGQPSAYTLLAGRHRFEEVLRNTACPGLWLAPSNLDLAGAELELANEIGREVILRDALAAFATTDAVDIVLLDCPPALGLLSLNALVAATDLLVPLQAEFFALQGMSQLLGVVDRVRQRLNPSLTTLGLLVGQFNSTRNLSGEVLEELRRHFGDQVMPTIIRTNVRLAEAPSHGQTVFEYAPDSPGAADFAAATEELERRLKDAARAPMTAQSATTEQAKVPPAAASGASG